MESEKKKRIKQAGLIVFGACIVLTALWILKPPCLIRRVFHVLCPSCGTTRMVSALLRFDFAEAWALNPFMLFFLPFALLWGVSEAVRYVKGKVPLISERAGVVIWALWFIAAIAFGVWRNFV